MIGLFPTTTIFLATAPTDLRKAYDGLAALVRQSLGQDPLNGSLYVFCNRRRHQTTFNIPIRLRSDRLPVASTARTAVAGSPAKGTERDRGH